MLAAVKCDDGLLFMVKEQFQLLRFGHIKLESHYKWSTIASSEDIELVVKSPSRI